MPLDNARNGERFDPEAQHARYRRKRPRSPILPNHRRRRSCSRDLHHPSSSDTRPLQHADQHTDFISESRTKAAFDYCKRLADEKRTSVKIKNFSSTTGVQKSVDQGRCNRDTISSRWNYSYDQTERNSSACESGSSVQPTTDQPKELPNFGLSGKLLGDTNKVRGTIVKYAEPTEARIPNLKWRLYTFKDNQIVDTLHVYRQSSYLFGRDRKVVDIPVDHPSCSKQHAVLQFRAVDVKDELISYGTPRQTVKPYILDLNSANGTFINQKQVEPQRFVELIEKDVIKFGFSTREYVLLHDTVAEKTASVAHQKTVEKQPKQADKTSARVVALDDEDDEQNFALPEIPNVEDISESQQKRLHRLTTETLTDFY